MAAADKTYLKSWEEYVQLRDWLKDKFCYDKPYIDSYGERHENLHAIDFLITWDKEDVDKIIAEHGEDADFPVLNTPEWFDVWLIQNCPLDFIQEQLKDMYGGGYCKTAFTGHNNDDEYEQIKAGNSVFDKWPSFMASRKKASHFERLTGRVYFGRVRSRWGQKNNLYIEVIDNETLDGEKIKWYYNSANDQWVTHFDFGPISSSWNSFEQGIHFNIHWLKRKLKKWNLPAGVTLKFTNMIFVGKRRYIPQEFNLKLK